MGFIKQRGLHSLVVKLCIGPQKFSRCKNVLEVLCHCTKFGEARISPASDAAKNVQFFCLILCLSVTLVNVRVCAHDFVMKALEYRNNFDAVG